jgi:glycosyltransferase involved in cell wall biosynthesis
MKKVVIFQDRLLHYRLNLFQRLREACSMRGIELCLVHGQASRRELTRKDEGTLSWTYKINNRYWEIGKRDVIWQSFPIALLKDADLAVLMQENRNLSNYRVLLSRLYSSCKVAYWGHGKNFQSDAPTGLREKWKEFLLTRVDWWFAYTDVTVDILREAGYAEERITCLDNSIDNDGFNNDLASVSEKRLNELQTEIGAGDETKIGLFCGSLYPDKRLAYMVEAADQIRRALPDFRLLVIGDGPSASEMRAAAESRPWLKCLGVRRGLEKAEYFRLADICFNPGAVGLHVLDAFCAGIPMATTVDARHGPEIAYLKDGRNGIITEGGPENYAERIIKLLSTPAEYQRLCLGAKEGAKRYTLNNMVDRFVDGIEKCLTLPK